MLRLANHIAGAKTGPKPARALPPSISIDDPFPRGLVCPSIVSVLSLLQLFVDDLRISEIIRYDGVE